ncbi:MAG: hypothetical protein IPN29_08390 [Saprospiraceae bacterium]|nr:hypothetical protein [Saprospiraceae bacterium]
MKRIFFLFAFVLAAGLTANAQCTKSASADKACCASKKTASADAKVINGTKVAAASMESEAEMAAASNENIQKRVCEQSGKVSYYEKSVCEHSGSVSWNEVEYNNADKKFSRVASAGMERNAATGDVKITDGKACCKKDGDKSCCKKEGSKACAGDKAGTK